MAKTASQWKVESFRCTSFPVEDSNFDPSNWWADVTGKQPDQVTTKPNESSFVAQGDLEKGSLQLLVQPLRIQWMLSPSPPHQMEDTRQVQTVGDMAQIDNFIQLVKKWLAVAPPMSRLAFGAVLLIVVDDVKSGYVLLDRFLHSVDIDADEMSEFIYQVNRIRASKTIDGGEVNRLSRWSVALINPVTIQIQDGQATVQSKAGDPKSAVRLELDINNVPTPELTFAGEEASSLFDELVGLGNEISDSGDIA